VALAARGERERMDHDRGALFLGCARAVTKNGYPEWVFRWRGFGSATVVFYTEF
jgi:hypothetical protein